jgi:hypothetical protein
MAKQKLQTEVSLQQKSVVLLCIQKGESQRKLAEQLVCQRRQLQTLRKMNTPL